MRFIIACGGTAGHITPGLLIADRLRYDGDDVIFIGANNRMEMNIIPQHGYVIHGIDICGLNMKHLWHNIVIPYKLIKAVTRCRHIIKDYKPDAVIGTGGYVAMPTILAAWIMHIPIFLQEQNSMPGITNRVCAHFARKIFAAFDNVKNILGTKKTILTGNPITLTPQVDVETCYKYFGLTKNKLVLLVMGGSLGAKSIIDFTSSHAQLFEEKGINVILSLGKNNIPPNNQSPNIKIVQYIERMDYAYTIADIVISRAGAMSISELCAYKKASILIPYPNALNDHQTINAMTLAEHNAAILVKESDMESSLINALSFAIKNRNSLEENISKMSKPNATVEIVKYIKQYVNT